MREFADVNELIAAVGEHLGWSEPVVIDQKQVDGFAEATGDRQWIHVDPQRAATGPFGTTIVHGYLTLSLVPVLTGQIYRVGGLALVINYGVDQVRFPAPLPVGSTLRAGAELLSARTTSRGVRIVVRITMNADGIAKPVCVADSVLLLVPEAARSTPDGAGAPAS